MTDSTDRYWTALERNPECARRIGVIIGLFAAVEIELVDTFRWIANMEIDPARVALESQGQFSKKIEFVEAVCGAVQPNWDRDIEAGREFIAALKIAKAMRNKYAHAMYGWTGVPGSETLFVNVYANSLGSALREETATVATLDEDIAFFKLLIEAMKQYSQTRAASKDPDLSGLKRAISAAKPRRPRFKTE